MKRPRKWMGQGLAKRREGSMARKVAAAARTPGQQMARLDRAGWQARRERARLRQRMGAGQ